MVTTTEVENAVKPHWTQTPEGRERMSKAMKLKHAQMRVEGKPWKKTDQRPTGGVNTKPRKAKPTLKHKTVEIPLTAIPHPAPAKKRRGKYQPKVVKATAEGKNTRQVALEMLRMALQLLGG